MTNKVVQVILRQTLRGGAVRPASLGSVTRQAVRRISLVMNCEISECRQVVVTSPADLTDLCQTTIDQVAEMEECWKRGVLKLPLASREVRATLGPVAHAYEMLQVRPDDAVVRYRENWMQTVLDEFSRALAEPRIRLRSSVTGGLHQVEYRGQQFLLRADQAASVRSWGISIEPDAPGPAAALANQIFQEARARLAGEVDCVGLVCSGMVRNKVFPDAVRWGVGGCGRAFEQLTMDILNEETRHAKRATLFEDLFEWTDLRVRYPGLPRMNGARVQVKLSKTKHDEKIPPGRRSETHVLLSPVRLAGHAVAFCKDRREPGLEDGFWESIPGNPVDAEELAEAMFLVFHAAIKARTNHPLGPMALIHPAVRRFLRSYVCEQSFEAARRMMERANAYPECIPPWRRSFR